VAAYLNTIPGRGQQLPRGGTPRHIHYNRTDYRTDRPRTGMDADPASRRHPRLTACRPRQLTWSYCLCWKFTGPTVSETRQKSPALVTPGPLQGSDQPVVGSRDFGINLPRFRPVFTDTEPDPSAGKIAPIRPSRWQKWCESTASSSPPPCAPLDGPIRDQRGVSKNYRKPFLQNHRRSRCPWHHGRRTAVHAAGWLRVAWLAMMSR